MRQYESNEIFERILIKFSAFTIKSIVISLFLNLNLRSNPKKLLNWKLLLAIAFANLKSDWKIGNSLKYKEVAKSNNSSYSRVLPPPPEHN